MPQRPKESVRRTIIAAAMQSFAESGYERATLGAIAQRAGTSVGNLYKYFANKDELFAAALPADFTTELEQRIQRQVEALGLERDAFALEPGHPYRRASEDLLRFSIEHRARIVFLLRHAEGTGHAAFAQTLVRRLVTLALRYAEGAYPGFSPHPALRRSLARTYRTFVATIAAILEEERSERALREAVRQLVTYHLSGLRALFQAHASGAPAGRSTP
jgi:AcrR family transcriptional regulator